MARMGRRGRTISTFNVFFWALAAAAEVSDHQIHFRLKMLLCYHKIGIKLKEKIILKKALDLGQEFTSCVEQGEEVDACTVR